MRRYPPISLFIFKSIGLNTDQCLKIKNGYKLEAFHIIRWINTNDMDEHDGQWTEACFIFVRLQYLSLSRRVSFTMISLKLKQFVHI